MQCAVKSHRDVTDLSPSHNPSLSHPPRWSQNTTYCTLSDPSIVTTLLIGLEAGDICPGPPENRHQRHFAGYIFPSKPNNSMSSRLFPGKRLIGVTLVTTQSLCDVKEACFRQTQLYWFLLVTTAKKYTPQNAAGAKWRHTSKCNRTALATHTRLLEQNRSKSDNRFSPSFHHLLVKTNQNLISDNEFINLEEFCDRLSK